MKSFLYLTCFLFIGLLLILTGCSNRSQSNLKVAATSVPHAEILEFIKPHLQQRNVTLEIIVIDDFNTPNRALADGEVDANFFQHLPFLQEQQKDFNYHLESLAVVHLEPMGIYSKKISSLADLPHKAKVAIPSDPTNQARALALLQQTGLLTLKSTGIKATILDIVDNPHQLQLLEIDSALLCRTLDDVDAAAISTNFALLAGLSPHKESLAMENAQSDFVNLVAIRQGEAQRHEFQTLKEVLHTNDVRQFIEDHYQGAVIPAF